MMLRSTERMLSLLLDGIISESAASCFIATKVRLYLCLDLSSSAQPSYMNLLLINNYLKISSQFMLPSFSVAVQFYCAMINGLIIISNIKKARGSLKRKISGIGDTSLTSHTYSETNRKRSEISNIFLTEQW
jgi:hypothetical protein